MDQTIGIGYQVDGVEQVVKANDRVITSFEKVISKVGTMATTLGTFASQVAGFKQSMSGLVTSGGFADTFKGSSKSINAAGKSTTRFNTAIEKTPGKVDAAASKIRELTSAVNSYSAAVGAVKPIPMSPVGAPGAAGGKATGSVSSIHNRDILSMTPRFMFAWRAGSEAIQGTQYLANDVLLGRNREGLAAGLGQLSPLGFDKKLKQRTEISAKLFSQKFWTVSAESYVEAMSQTASAFSVEKLGYENLQKMNEASIKLSLVAKMSTSKAAELTSSIILGMVTQLPSEIAEKLNAGLKADVKGYGHVDLGGLAQGVSAQAAKTIAVSSIWGPGIQSGFRGALPSLLARNYSLPSALAMIGAYADVGFQAGQGGKTVRDLYEKEPINFAKTLVYGTGNWKSQSPSLDAKTLAENKKHNAIATEIALKKVNAMLADEELAPELFQVVGQIIKRAEAEGVPLKEFGFSQYYLPMIRKTVEKSYQDRVAWAKKLIAEASDPALTLEVLETLDDAGTAYKKVSGAVHDYFTTISDTPAAHWLADKIATPVKYQNATNMLETYVKRNKLDKDATEKLFQEHKSILDWTLGPEKAEAIRTRLGKIAAGDPLPGRHDRLLARDTLSQDMLGDVFGKLKEGWDWYVANSGLTGKGATMTEDYNVISAELYTAAFDLNAKIVGALNFVGDYINDTLSKLWGFFQGIRDKIDGFLFGNKVIPAPQGQGDAILPEEGAVEPYWMPSRMIPSSYNGPGMGTPPEVILTSNINAALNFDGRVLAHAIADIIQNNRDVHYHGYGGDPMGFVT